MYNDLETCSGKLTRLGTRRNWCPDWVTVGCIVGKYTEDGQEEL